MGRCRKKNQEVYKLYNILCIMYMFTVLRISSRAARVGSAIKIHNNNNTCLIFYIYLETTMIPYYIYLHTHNIYNIYVCIV